MARLKILLIFPLILFSFCCKSQDKEIQFETKLITAFMHYEEADSNVISEDYDTIFIGYYFNPNACRVYKYVKKQLLSPSGIDTPYFRIFDREGATISIIPDVTRDTINLSFTYRNIVIQSGYISFSSNLSMLRSWCNHQQKDSLLNYYADFRKDSAYERGLRKKYYEHFNGEGFSGLSRKALVRLLGEPDKIDMKTEKGNISVDNSYFYYNVDFTSKQNGPFANTRRRRFQFLISNGFVYKYPGFFYTEDLIESSAW